MASELVDGIMTGYGTFWAALNTYTFYPLARKRVNDWVHGEDDRNTDELFAEFDEDELPAIDLFLPAYNESEVIHQSIGSANELEYPEDKMNLHVLLEPDDDETRDALETLSEGFSFNKITVPADYPGENNKPRALNYGFDRSEGDIVGILDAEDIVDPDLLKEVVIGLETEDNDYAQGILHMSNEDGWLNRQFTGEYGYWFRKHLPSFLEADYPVPLGGTTNFLKRDILEETSNRRRDIQNKDIYDHVAHWAESHDIPGSIPWDPENVTEDFELGMFLWQHDYDMTYLDAITIEESPQHLKDWLKQRTRWKKGKLQTLKTYLDNPPEGVRDKFHTYMQSAMPHIGPINATGVIMGASAYTADVDPGPVSETLLFAGAAGVAVHMYNHADGYWTASDEDSTFKKAKRTIEDFLTLPIGYWPLQWVADTRAIKQEYLGNGEWEKTPHYGVEEGEQWKQKDVEASDEPTSKNNDVLSPFRNILDSYRDRRKKKRREKAMDSYRETYGIDGDASSVDQDSSISDASEQPGTEQTLPDDPDDSWTAIDQVLEREPASTRSGVESLLSEYEQEKGDFGTTRKRMLTYLDELPGTSHETSEERAYLSDDALRQELLEGELYQTSTGLTDEEIAALTRYAAQLGDGEDDASEEPSARTSPEESSTGLFGAVTNRLKKYLPGSSATQERSEEDIREEQVNEQIRSILGKTHEEASKQIAEYLLPLYVNKTDEFGEGRENTVDRLIGRYEDYGYDSIAMWTDDELQKKLFKHELQRYTDDLSEEDRNEIVVYAHELRTMPNVSYEVNEKLEGPQDTAHNGNETLSPSGDVSLETEYSTEQDVRSSDGGLEEQEQYDETGQTEEVTFETGIPDTALPEDYVEDEIEEEYEVVNEFLTTGYNKYQKVETDDGFEYLKNGAPVSQQSYAGGSAHRLPGA